jgi:ABC-type sugar transport system permease subunit
MTLSAQAQRRMTIFTFLVVPVTSMVVLGIWPVLQLFYLSFTEFNGVNWKRIEWVGLQNYQDLFGFDRELLYPMVNSLFYLVGSLVQLALATWFAVILNQKLPGSKLFRTILFIPFVLNAVAAALVFRNFLEINGALNDIMAFFFGEEARRAWIDASDRSTNFSLAAASVWRYLGFNLVVTFGALQAIPQDQYDAAKLEGASGWQEFWRITFPSIKLVLLLQFMLSVVGSLEVYEIPFLVTQAAGKTSTFAFEMLTTGFQLKRVGTAAAMAVLMLAIVAALFVITRWISIRKDRADARRLT